MAAWMPRVAFDHPFDSHQKAFNGSVLLKGFDGVMGAGRVEAAAVPKEGANRHLIDSDEKNHHNSLQWKVCVFLLPASPAL